MKIEDKVFKLNNFIRDKKYRLFISLLAIGHGIIRIVENATFTSVSFGTDSLFAILLITFGTLLGITAAQKLRYSIFSHIVAAILASIYAALGVAMIDKNIGSAYTTFMIVIFLLIEELLIYEH